MNAREEIQLVLKIMLKYARKQLQEDGGFQAFGATLGSNRDVLMLLPESQPDDASFADVREHWYRALRKAIDDGGCRTVAWCCNVKAPGENDTRVPAVFVHVEHVEGEAWDMYFPFATDSDSNVLYGEQTELAVKGVLFTRDTRRSAEPDPPIQSPQNTLLQRRNNMIEQAIAIRTSDGTADGFLFQPETTGRWPGVIHLTDIAGIRPSERDMCRRLSSEGYVVLMPNVYYRTGKPPLVDFPFKPGDEKTVNRISEMKAPLTPEAIARDGSAYVDFVAAQESVKSGAMGIVGYCFTGAVALRIAAARPDKIAAAASFHGGGLFTDAPTSPHHVLPQVKARLYFGHAIEDRSMPKAAIENLEKALKAWGGKFESETYEGAHHSWTTPDSPAYDKKQADRAFGKLTDLLAATLS